MPGLVADLGQELGFVPAGASADHMTRRETMIRVVRVA
jgi:hypothetical protein